MARNVEIKARIDGDVDALTRKVAALADSGPSEIAQDDTFFHCASGRLKLRAYSDTEGELIHYRRPDEPGPKTSDYVRSPTAQPQTLREALTRGCGQAGRVVKQRTVYLVGRTRVHLDRVVGLGHYLELEVVLADGEDEAAGVQEAHAVMGALGVEPAQLVDAAYVDLLARASA
jgi:predicted adenylyl cyclase CyaB